MGRPGRHHQYDGRLRNRALARDRDHQLSALSFGAVHGGATEPVPHHRRRVRRDPGDGSGAQRRLDAPGRRLRRCGCAPLRQWTGGGEQSADRSLHRGYIAGHPGRKRQRRERRSDGAVPWPHRRAHVVRSLAEPRRDRPARGGRAVRRSGRGTAPPTEARFGPRYFAALSISFRRGKTTLRGNRFANAAAARRASGVRPAPTSARTRKASRSSANRPFGNRRACSASNPSASAKSPPAYAA